LTPVILVVLVLVLVLVLDQGKRIDRIVKHLAYLSRFLLMQNGRCVARAPGSTTPATAISETGRSHTGVNDPGYSYQRNGRSRAGVNDPGYSFIASK